jgi:hypothetical protein
MAQSTPINSYCSRASFRCAYMHHIEKYVFQQETVAPGSGLLLLWCSEHPQYEYTESNRVVLGGLSGTTAGPAGIYVYNRRRMARPNHQTKNRTSGTVSAQQFF